MAELMEERREERAGVGRVVTVVVICWACAAGGCLLGREGGWKPRRWWCVTYRSQGREGGENGGVVHFGGCDVSRRGGGLVVETGLVVFGEACVMKS
jgi:hypothetical protein